VSFHHGEVRERLVAHQGVYPHVTGGATVQGAVPEGGHLGVELGGHAGHLRAGDPVDAHRFD
jgi:hypothetical protein